MKLSMQQSVVMKQELRMNPRLYQAMDLLYMPMLDLQQHLKGELLSNPFLEMQEPDEEEESTTDKAKEKEKTDKSEGKDETNWEEFILDGFNNPGRRAEFEQRELRTKCIVCCETPAATSMRGLSWCDPCRSGKHRYGTIERPTPNSDNHRGGFKP